MKTQPRLDKEGKPYCDICDKSFDRVISHVRQAHGITGREYKKQFGYSLSKGITSAASANASSVAIKREFARGNATAFVKASLKTRFKPAPTTVAKKPSFWWRLLTLIAISKKS
jgi:hypothetical protein